MSVSGYENVMEPVGGARMGVFIVPYTLASGCL